MRKSKKYYHGYLNEKYAIGKNRFWKAVKPLLSDKVKSSEKMTFVHEDKIITNDDENAKILNSSVSNVIEQLKIPDIHNSKIFIFQQNASFILI